MTQLNEAAHAIMLDNVNFQDNWFKEQKTQIIEACAIKYAALPKQGTREWKIIRLSSFGGSELSVLEGVNPYSKMKDLIASKLGLTTFNGSVATRWGNLFEHITEQLTARIFGVDRLWELSSIPGFCANHRFSPDGLGVFPIRCQMEINGVIYNTIEYLSVLLEYKSPFSTLPNGKIPKHYLPQVKGGICDFDFVDIGLFVNNTYRKCSLSDFKFDNAYDHKIHTKGDVYKTPIAAGLIRFYQTDEQRRLMSQEFGLGCDSNPDSDVSSDEETHKDMYRRRKNMTLEERIFHCVELGMMDMGKLGTKKFGALLKLYMNGMLSADFGHPLIFRRELHRIDLVETQITVESDERDYDKEMKVLTKTRIAEGGVGVLPWKMFISNMIFQERDDSYKAVIEPRIQEGAAILKDIQRLVDDEYPSREVLVERFYTHFENKGHYIDRQIEQDGFD
jgi:hypothetical protein